MTETHEHTHEEHQHSLLPYVFVFLALCVLTAASFATTTMWWKENVPPLSGWIFMLAVSVCKAVLVAMFFMHLLWEKSWKWILTVPTICMALFLSVALIPDIGLRRWYYSEERAQHVAEPSNLLWEQFFPEEEENS